MLPESATLDTYGGPKVNKLRVQDPTSQEDATHRNEAFSDAAAMTRTSPRAIVRFVAHATTPTLATSGFSHVAHWVELRNEDTPVPSHDATARYLLTWPATVTDELGVEHDLNFRLAEAWVESTDGTLRHAKARVTAANVIEVRTWVADGTSDDLAGQVIAVLVW